MRSIINWFKIRLSGQPRIRLTIDAPLNSGTGEFLERLMSAIEKLNREKDV